MVLNGESTELNRLDISSNGSVRRTARNNARRKIEEISFNARIEENYTFKLCGFWCVCVCVCDVNTGQLRRAELASKISIKLHNQELFNFLNILMKGHHASEFLF